MNVTLIGMSGVGKTYVGKRLAKKLGRTCIDIDQEIEREEGKIIPELLEELGDDKFIAHESDATIRLTNGKDNIIISTAGSVVYGVEAMEHLSSNSKIIYLEVPASVVMGRIGGNADRVGRIVRKGNRTLAEVLEERVPLYEKYAHHTIDTRKYTLEELVQAVAELC